MYWITLQYNYVRTCVQQLQYYCTKMIHKPCILNTGDSHTMASHTTHLCIWMVTLSDSCNYLSINNTTSQNYHSLVSPWGERMGHSQQWVQHWGNPKETKHPSSTKIQEQHCSTPQAWSNTHTQLLQRPWSNATMPCFTRHYKPNFTRTLAVASWTQICTPAHTKILHPLTS